MERQYLFTERAHLMCPGMCFGLAALIDAPHDAERIRAAVAALEEAHPFLRAVIGHQAEDNRFFYDVTAVGKTDWTDAHEEIAGLDAPAIFGRCDELTGRDWDLRTEGLLKIVTWKANERLCALFVFHHLLTDGRGALGLVQEFADCYVTGRRPACAQERLIARAEDLPDGAALKGVARWLVARTNQKWRGEGRRLDYAAYHSFADGYVRSQRVAHRCETIDGERLARLSGQCHDRGVTLNDYLAARMMFEEQTNKVIIACDLRQRLKCYRSGALGNYATAFSVKLGRRGGDALTLAKAVHVAVRKVMKDDRALCTVLSCYAMMEPGLLDAAAISALGGYESPSAAFVGQAMFGMGAPRGISLTNLGKIESACLSEAMFIPPASPAMRRTVGAVTVNGRMILCDSARR